MWAQVINTMLGLWLMAAPAALGYGRPAATNDWIVGPLVATFACIAIWECTRSLRWLNAPLGVWLLIAPWLLDYSWEARANSVAVGLAITALAFVGGQITEQFGGGWSVLWERKSNG